MAMSRKHYVALAEAFRSERPAPDEKSYEVWKQTLRNVADVCKRDNFNFNYSTFYTAAGYTSDHD